MRYEGWIAGEHSRIQALLKAYRHRLPIHVDFQNRHFMLDLVYRHEFSMKTAMVVQHLRQLAMYEQLPYSTNYHMALR